MQKYEIMVKSFSDDVDLSEDRKFLLEQGQEGWRLVSTVKTTRHIIYYMERPIPSSRASSINH